MFGFGKSGIMNNELLIINNQQHLIGITRINNQRIVNNRGPIIQLPPPIIFMLLCMKGIRL